MEAAHWFDKFQHPRIGETRNLGVFGDVPTPGFQRSLLSDVVDASFQIFSPDQLEVVRFARKALNDPHEHPFIKGVAVLLGVNAFFQGSADTVNRLRGQRREWVFGDIPGVPTREKFISDYKSAGGFASMSVGPVNT